MKKLLLMFAVLATAISASAENYILYTTSNGNVLSLNTTSYFCGANIVSNTYENGQGKILLDGEVTTIGAYAFKNCTNLTSVVIPKSVTEIDSWAFYGCSSLTSLKIPNSVTGIGWCVFQNCHGLTSLVIPNSVTWIGISAFHNCSNLTSVVIGKSVKNIENGVFEKCTKLAEIKSLNTTPPSVKPGAFKESLTSTCVLKVPAQSVGAYKAADGWKDFSQIVGISESKNQVSKQVKNSNPSSPKRQSVHQKKRTVRR